MDVGQASQRLSRLRDKIKARERAYHEQVGRKAAIEARLATQRDELHTLEVNSIMFREELDVILKAGTRQLQSAADNLASFADYAIPKVFGPDYESLRIELDTNGRSNKARIVLSEYQDGILYDGDPYEDNGGGVNDTASILLKLAALNGFEPKVDNALLCDEPSKHVSAEYRTGLATIFREMTRSTGRQIIMGTHDQAMTQSSDNVIQID